MSGTNIRVADLPDLGAVHDTSSVVADTGTSTGRFSALSLKSYCAVATIPEAPSTNTPYGRMNGAWTPVLNDAPSTGASYARLNATWSVVVPEAPLTGNIYGRGNSGWTTVLPMTGGTISGNLGATGNINAGGGVYAAQFNLSPAAGYEWQFYIEAGSGDHIQGHRTNWSQRWASATGTHSWNSPSGQQMSLTSAGVLSVSGYGYAPAFWSSTLAAGQFGFGAGGSGRIFSFRPSFYLDHSTVAGGTDGTLQYVVSNGPLWVMRPSDDFCFNPQSSVGGNGAYINTSDRRAKENIAPTARGLAEVLQLQPVSFQRTNPASPEGAPLEIGFIAQDVQPIVPEAVWGAGIPLKDGTGGLDSAEPTLGLTSETITAISVNAIKELNDMIAALTARVATLEGAG
jgi:hypothetical protein